MIVWIDGTYGVGKTSVALKLVEKLKEKKFELLKSDEFYVKMIQNNYFLGGGTLPQNNMNFLKYFKNEIEKKVENSKKNLIIDMSLTQKECKEVLLDYFGERKLEMKHFILTADIKTIKTRIECSENRDKKFALSFLESNINFLNNNYKDVIKIDTTNLTVNKIVEDIIKIL